MADVPVSRSDLHARDTPRRLSGLEGHIGLGVCDRDVRQEDDVVGLRSARAQSDRDGFELRRLRLAHIARLAKSEMAAARQGPFQRIKRVRTNKDEIHAQKPIEGGELGNSEFGFEWLDRVAVAKRMKRTGDGIDRGRAENADERGRNEARRECGNDADSTGEVHRVDDHQSLRRIVVFKLEPD